MGPRPWADAVTSYDGLGRAYQISVYGVDPASGAVGGVTTSYG